MWRSLDDCHDCPHGFGPNDTLQYCKRQVERCVLNGKSDRIKPSKRVSVSVGEAVWAMMGGAPHLMPLQWADGVPPNIDTTANKWWRNTGMGDD